MQFFSLNKIILLAFLFFSTLVSSQPEKERELDSLLRLLKTEKGRVSADLNSKIALLYIDQFDQLDSSYRYAGIANHLATKERNKYIVAESFVTLGRVKMDENQLDSAQSLFFQALMSLNSATKNSAGKYEQIIVNFSDYRTCKIAAHIYANFANASRKKLNFSKAADFYLRALKAYEVAHDSTVREFVSCMESKGEKMRKEDLTIKAAQDYLKKHPEDLAAKKAGEEGAQMLAGIRWTCLDLGGLFEKTKDYNHALIYLKRAEENAEAVGAKESHLKILGSLGAVYQKRKDYDSAVIYYKKLCRRSEELQIIQGVIEGQTKIGMCCRESGDYEKALQAYEKVSEALKPLNDGTYKSNPMYSYLPERLITGKVFQFRSAINLLLVGDLNTKKGDLSKAGKNYEEALGLMEEVWDQKKNDGDSMTLVNIKWTKGNLLSRLKQHARAINEFNAANQFAEKFLNIEDRISFYNDAREALEKSGDDKSAYSFYKKYIALKDSVFSQNMANEMAEFQKRFEVEKKDADIELLNKAGEAKEAELEKQKLVRNGFIAGSVIFLLLTLVIFRSLQQNRKAKKIIENQKEEVEHKNKEILDSITYAKRIQTALMPRKEYFEKAIGRLNQKQ